MIPIEEIARRAVTPEQLRDLSRIDGVQALASILTQWLVIAGAIAVTLKTQSWIVYLCAVPVIGTRQHALGVIMHDAAHYRLLPSRVLNDLVSDLFCALPGLVITSRFRSQHLAHHRAPNTPDDPYYVIHQRNPRCWAWPRSLGSALGVIARDLTALNLPFSLREAWPWSPLAAILTHDAALTKTELLTTGLFSAGLLLILWRFDLWLYFLAFWLVPMFTVLPLLVRLRSVAEHHNLAARPGTEATRNISGNWLERQSISPLNINHHLTHHIFPGIPQYRLAHMTALLMQDPEFRRRAESRQRYFGAQGVFRRELICP